MTEDAETEQTEQVTFTIANLRAVAARDLFALLDVEVRVAGLSFWIMGVQGRRARNGGALIQLPTYRDTDGRARPAVVMPEELRKPLVDAVMEFLAEEGASGAQISGLKTSGRCPKRARCERSASPVLLLPVKELSA